MNKSLSSRRILRKRADEESGSSLSCYECSAHNPQCGIDETTITKGCRACLVFRNMYDNSESVCSGKDAIVCSSIQTMFFDDAVHQVVENLILLESMKVEQHIFADPICAMESDQKMNFLLKKVSLSTDD